MKCEDSVAKDVAELIAVLQALCAPGSPAVCRGQAIADWRLQPSIDRDVAPDTPYARRLDEERCLIEQFRRRAERLLGVTEWRFVAEAEAANLHMPLTVMQHFGAPTRLLDWTHSPFAAAFFAAIDHLDQDGAVWWFRITPFEHAAGEQWDRLAMRAREGDHVDYNRFAFAEDSPGFLGTTYLRIPFARLEAQQGLFTIAGRLGLLHDELLCDLMPAQNFGRIVVPSGIKRATLDALQTMNVTAKSLEHVGADRLGVRMAWERTHGT